jgi:hypothetical protein
MGVIGCILIDHHCITEWLSRFGDRSDACYDPRHQTIMDALMSMHRDGKGSDIILLHQRLKDNGELDDAGGMAYLSSLPESTHSAAAITYYVDIVWEKYELRKVVQRCTSTVAKVYEYQGPAEKLIDEIHHGLRSISTPNARGKCQRFKVSDLENFDLENDEDNMVGRRYLTRGSSLLLNGPSGRGKSSLLMMRIIQWARGLPFFGMKPTRPLSSVIWQTENNEGDLAKAYQGARNFLKLRELEFEQGGVFDQLEKNIEFVYCPALCGREFLDFAELELTKNPRDIAVLDPLVSFPEGDLNSQQGAAEFLRKGLARISFLTKATWVINHHTPKPLRDPRNNRATKKISEYQYGGAGSFDIPGWARAVETLEESEDGVFRLVIAKRGADSGACHPDGTPTFMLWLRHSTEGGMHWEQMDPPSEPEPSEAKGGKPSIVREIASSNLYAFLSGCKAEGEGLNEISKRLEQHLAKESRDVSLNTCKRIIPLLVTNGKLTKTSESKYVSGPNK